MLDHKNLEQFTGFNKVFLNLENPQMKFDVEYKQLSILCGTNGVGKSFSNKLTWANVFTFNLFLIELQTPNVLGTEFTNEETLQFVLDTTFEEQDFTGKVRFYSTDHLLDVPHYIIEYTLTEGKVSDLYIDYPKGAKPSGIPTYLSKETRQFSYLDKYLTMKDLLGVSAISDFDGLKLLTEHFTLYDIFAMEQIVNKLPQVNQVIQKLGEGMKEALDGLDLESMFYNPDKKGICYTNANGDIKKVTTLGSGHQALLIMFLGVIPTDMEKM